MNKSRLSYLRFLIPFAAIPAVILAGQLIAPSRWHLLFSLAIAVLSLVLFALTFQKSSVRTGRLVLAAVMTALSVAGRFIPVFKPITAMTVIAAVNLGGEAGFLVGALSALISNFYFGQGPWTAFQMLAWGMIGLIAGFMSGPLNRHKSLLLVFGALSGIFYSFVMDIWTVISYNDYFDWKLYLASLVTALPYTVIYAVSNVAFLAILSDPIKRKIGRVLVKYRL